MAMASATLTWGSSGSSKGSVPVANRLGQRNAVGLGKMPDIGFSRDSHAFDGGATHNSPGNGKTVTGGRQQGRPDDQCPPLVTPPPTEDQPHRGEKEPEARGRSGCPRPARPLRNTRTATFTYTGGILPWQRLTIS